MDPKYLYARITISADAIEYAATVDNALAKRMAGLSPTRRRKSWRRIQGYRFYSRVWKPEMDGLIQDLRRRFDTI